MNILVACEESQRVTMAFREKGHNAFSCDIIECSGGFPEFHIQQDVTNLLNGHTVFSTVDGKKHGCVSNQKWDMIIAHPPCTHLSVSGARWFTEGKKPLRLRDEAADFFMLFVNAECDKKAIENPVGVMSTRYRKPDQIIQPYMFGDPYEKRTCLWLFGLSNLHPTDVVKPEPRVVFKNGRSMPKWYSDAFKLPKEERSKIRSRTFIGIAKAMAEQWG